MSDLIERLRMVANLKAKADDGLSADYIEWHAAAALEVAERERKAMSELLLRCRPSVRSHYMRAQQAVLNNKVPHYSDVLEQDEKKACELLDAIDALPRDEPPAKDGL